MFAPPLAVHHAPTCRLKLREGDDQFFLKNIVNEFLPIKYQLAGVAAMYGEERDDGDETSSSRRGRSADRDRERSRSSSFDASSSYTSASSSAGFGLPEQPNLEGIMPLENETWWRIVSGRGCGILIIHGFWCLMPARAGLAGIPGHSQRTFSAICLPCSMRTHPSCETSCGKRWRRA